MLREFDIYSHKQIKFLQNKNKFKLKNYEFIIVYFTGIYIMDLYLPGFNVLQRPRADYVQVR